MGQRVQIGLQKIPELSKLNSLRVLGRWGWGGGGGCLSFRIVLCVGCLGGTGYYVCIEYYI